MTKQRGKFFILCVIAILISTFFISFYNNNYIDHNENDFVLNDLSCDLLAKSLVDTNDDLPEDAVAINNAEALKDFLVGDESYGYLTTDILLDWDEVGSTVIFEKDRIIDGRGHVVSLEDKEAIAQIYENEIDAININELGIANDSNYGLFVSVNEGIIKNIKFEFASQIYAVNDGNVVINNVGIVCGENKGAIEKCELDVSGRFSYYYINGETDESDEFQTYFGGFAGGNSGQIDRVTANYYDANISIRTIARSDDMFGEGKISAKTFAGGIAGIISDSGQCTNATISGRDVTFKLIANSVGNAKRYTYSGAVSAYSDGKIDNIIVDFAPDYVNKTDESFISKNAVVHCGQATNVTAIRSYDGDNLRCNNCNCAGHESYCNVINTDEYTKASVNIDNDGNQIVKITPKQGWIENLCFNKYIFDSSGNIIDDNALYDKAPDNFHSQNFEDAWVDGRTFRIAPYQNTGKSFWEITASSWRKAEIKFCEETKHTYSGKDMLKDFVMLKLSGVDDYCDCDFTKMNLENDGENIYQAKSVGEYNLSIRPIEINGKRYLYYDEENRIMAIAPDDYVCEAHKFYIDNIVVVTADWFVIDKVKEYDGTNEFDNERIQFNMQNESVMAYFSFLEYVEFSAYYSQIDAGDDIEIIIDVWEKEDADIIIDNQVRGVLGVIQRRKVTLTLDYAERTYGDTLTKYHYSADNVIDNIDVDFVSNANIYSLPDEQEYKFWLEESEFGNYSVANFDELNSYENGANLTIHKAIISQLADDIEDVIDLDADSVANLKIKFKDLVENDVEHTLDILYFNSDEGKYLPIDQISVSGEYKLKLVMPENLRSRYLLDERLSELQIRVIKADKPIVTKPNDDNDFSAESPKELNNNEIGLDNHISDNNSQNDTWQENKIDDKVNTYGNIAITVCVTSVVLIAVGVSKKFLLKRKSNKIK